MRRGAGGGYQCYCLLTKTYLQGSPPNKHRHTKNTFRSKKKKTKPPVCAAANDETREICVCYLLPCVCSCEWPRELPTSLHLHSALTNRVKQVVASEWVERLNQQKKKTHSVCCCCCCCCRCRSLFSMLLCCVTVSFPRLCQVMRLCVALVLVCVTLSIFLFLCVSFLFLFLVFFCFYLCVTVRPFLCGSVSCV